MIPRSHRLLPATQAALLRRVIRLEITTVVLMAAVTTMMALVAGQSQAMKTAWIEDLLSLVPPISFLVAARFARKRPDGEYINGRARAYNVAFVVSAVALTGVGLGLVFDGLHVLVTGTRPTIGAIAIGDALVWQGWLMMAALALSCIPPVVLGRIKLPLARELHLKSLHTDADTNKADWMTGLAGMAGVGGIALGWWWADAVAALVISGSVLRDGAFNLRHAIRDLHDARPETVERGGPDPLVDRVREAVAALDWVSDCEVRLHEEGMQLIGVLAVRPIGGTVTRERLREAEQVARATNWRVDDVTATLS